MKLIFLFLISSSCLFFSCVSLAQETEHKDHTKHSKQTAEVDHSQHQGMDHDKHQMMDHSQHMDHSGHHHHNMTLDAEGMVMNSNDSELPKDCSEISQEYNITVKAGIKYSYDFPGTIFGLDQHEIKVKPCSKLNITFINEDQVRHQWMVHGLPKYIYDQGMFHLEAAGGSTKSGTFIVPSDDKTYLIHCDIAQHMEKGMKAQLVVGKGNGDLPSVPGISGPWLKPD